MIKKIKYLLLIVLIAFVSLKAMSNKKLSAIKPLSESSYITLLTCDPGPQLYSVFGHNAIGVVDPEQKLSIVFNYGTFSFNVPFFYIKFASGRLLYKLSITSYHRFLYEYQLEQRMVIEEKLNLTQYQKQKIFNLLIENYKPENCEYQYDFFFDNCATRIINIFYEAFGDSIVYYPNQNNVVKTHRNLIDEYLINSYWSDFGIDIALGSVIDRPTTELEKAFLPDYLSHYLNRCTINGQPFIENKIKLVAESAQFPATPRIIRPSVIFWFLFIVVLFLTIFLRTKNWIIADKIIFSAFGIIGIIVLLLWLATEHDATAGNLNIFWANPLYIIYAWLLGTSHYKTIKWSSIAIVLINILILAGWSIIPQQYHIAFIPIIGILIIRSGVIALRYK